MDRYALDANAIAEDHLSERLPTRLLLREARRGSIELLIPQVAFDEAVNLFRERVAEHARDTRRGLRKLQGLAAIPAADATFEMSVDDAVDQYEARLEGTFLAAGAEFLPYPDVGHGEIARRAMDRRRPFDSEGRDGYRDTLLWETLVAAADPARPIVLVSADKAAFGSGDGLRAELGEELVERGIAAGAIRRIRRISDFTDPLPSVPELALSIEHLTATPGPVHDFFVDAIAEEMLDWVDQDAVTLGLSLNVDSVYVDSVDSVSDISVVSARELDDGLVAVDFRAAMEATFGLYVWKADAYGYEGDEVSIADYDYNESFAEGFTALTVELEVEAEYDRKDRELHWVRTYDLAPVGLL